ncbi:MAG: putative membrane protein [Planctomycetota bacterium]|jgi:uncharacterized membrane protein
MNDIYAAPEAELSVEQQGSRTGGSVEDAIAGNIEISMLGTLGEAWRGMKGFKLKCHLALTVYLIVYLLALALSFPVGFGLGAIGADTQSAGIIGGLVQFIAVVVTMPLMLGVIIMGLRHAAGESVTVGSIFSHFGSIPTLTLAYILQTILIMIGLLLLVLPGIYLMFAYMYAIPLVIEKKMPAWQALETSRKALTRVWFRFAGFILLITLIIGLGVLTLGIAWIWTIPWSVLAFAMVYLKLFGAEAETLADQG